MSVSAITASYKADGWDMLQERLQGKPRQHILDAYADLSRLT